MNPKTGPAALLNPRQIEAAFADLRTSLGLHPEWADLWNHRGLLEAHQGNLEAARSSLREALRRNGSYAAARANLAWVEALLAEDPADGPDLTGQPRGTAVRDAVTRLVAGETPDEEWSGTDPALAFLDYALAGAGTSPHDLTRSRARLAEVLPGADDLLASAGLERDGHADTNTLATLAHPARLNPDLADLLLLGARLEGIAGRTDEEERLHALAALYRGDRALYLVERGEAASRRGDSDEALRLLREAVEVQPEWQRTHQSLGYELSLRGVLKEALHHFEHAARLAPSYADILYQYGLLLHASGRNEEAIGAMGRALANNPSYVVARIALANLLFEIDRPAEAAPHYEHALEEGIETATLIGRFGYSLHASGDRNRAEELFLEAIARHRDRPELLALYGQFLAETDRKMEAHAVWRRALETGPPEWIRAEIETMRDDVPVDRRDP
ncbi:MAG TPA: tetratricopeptide repeat protein [bacterium]|nr:tetratricopeptide repeat protein [bacterium]